MIAIGIVLSVLAVYAVYLLRLCAIRLYTIADNQCAADEKNDIRFRNLEKKLK